MPPPPVPPPTLLKRLPSPSANECHFLKVYFKEDMRRRRLANMANACWRLVLLMEVELRRHATHPVFKSKDFFDILARNRKTLHQFVEREERKRDGEDDDDKEEEEDEEEEDEVVYIYKKIVFLTRLVEWAFENEPVVANIMQPEYRALKNFWMKSVDEWLEFANNVSFN
jgi:hypothetical protein